MLVEVCANSLESAIVAEQAGADRIELCAELAVGGITPSFGMLKAVMDKVSIPVHVLIRPRSGNFTYSEEELQVMLLDIEYCRSIGVSGIVSGVLKEDFTLDLERTRLLKEASGDLKFTFHRAFDWVIDPFHSLEQLESLSVDYILTSGHQKKAIEGLTLLKCLHQQSKAIQIMPGSGVNASNALVFKESGFKAIHLSGTAMVQKLATEPLVTMNSASFLSDNAIAITQLSSISSVVTTVK